MTKDSMGELIQFKPRTLKRNDLCHCGSGKKYKKCCLRKDEELTFANRNMPRTEQYHSFDTYVNSRAYHEYKYKVTRNILPLDPLIECQIKKLRAELTYEQAHDNEIGKNDSVQFLISFESNDDHPITEGIRRAINKYEQNGQVRDAMNGLRAGDETEVRIQFPRNHKSKLLKGRDISVRVKILEAKSWIEPSDGYLAEQHGYTSYQEMLDDIRFDIQDALAIEETLSVGSQIISQIIGSGKKMNLGDEDLLKACKEILRQELKDDFVELEKMGDANFAEYIEYMMEQSLVPLIAKAEGIKLSIAGQKDNIRKYKRYIALVALDNDFDNKEEKDLVIKSLIEKYGLYKHLIETLDIEYI